MKPIGRPAKRIEDLPEGWEIRLWEMGQEGMLDIDARVYLNIGKDIFYRWMEEYPHFQETINNMREASQTWWASIPRKAFKDGASKHINSNLWALVMRNKFKGEWNEAQTKVDITSNGEKIDGAKKIEIEIIRKTIEDGNKEIL
jgi:hypothetical protein